MSLLSRNMEDFIYLNKTISPDGQGGYYVNYVEGVTFKAHARLDSSTTAEIAKMQGVTSLYTITTTKEFPLSAKDVLRRVSDGKIFRLTSDGEDNQTPVGAGLNMRQAKAEEWRLETL